MKGIWTVATSLAIAALVQMAVPVTSEAVIIKTKPGTCGTTPCPSLVVSAGTGGSGTWPPFQLNKLTTISTIQTMTAPVAATMAAPMAASFLPSYSDSYLTAFDLTNNTDILFVDGVTESTQFKLMLDTTYDFGYTKFINSRGEEEHEWGLDECSKIKTDGTFIHLAYIAWDMADFNWIVSKDGIAPVPEPSTMLLLGFGLIGIAGSRIRRRMKNARN